MGKDSARAKKHKSGNRPTSSLDARIDQYWGEIYPIDYSLPLEPQWKELEKVMIKKYGKDVIDEFNKQSEIFGNCSRADRKRCIEFTYATGLYKEVSPTYALNGREILRFLVKKYSKGTDALPSKILDAGCGDMKITAGLLAFLPKKYSKDISIYGVDDSKAAITRAHEVIQDLHSKNRINGSVHAEYGDYINEDFLEIAQKKYDPGLVLLCRPDMICDAGGFIEGMRQQGRKVVGCFSERMEDGYDADSLAYMMLDSINYGLYGTVFSMDEHKKSNGSLILYGEFR